MKTDTMQESPETMESTGVDKTPNRISGMFNEIAPRYDLLNHLLSFGIDRSWRRATARALVRRLGGPGTTVRGPLLDVATGTGDLILELERRFRVKHMRFEFDESGSEPGQGSPFLGVDFSPGMLESARRKVESARRGDRIRLMEADGLNLPFESNRFAAVTIAFGLRNMHNAARGIGEMTRVCRAGGTVAILEFTMPTFPVFAQVYGLYFYRVLPRVGQWISGRRNKAYRYLQKSVVSFDAGTDVPGLMTEAGLTDVVTRRMTFGTVALYLGKKPE